jgi:predicted N-acetyltransferase YhbS
MMIVIRDYQETDAIAAGLLIADTYREFNLDFASAEERIRLLGPFHYARSTDVGHREAIAQVLQSPMCYVAEVEGKIVGVLRGRRERLASLFVNKKYHRQGIGRKLVRHFEGESVRLGVSVIRVASTLYAVPFYLKVGYKKSTGVRAGWSFEGSGLQYQPMKKTLAEGVSKRSISGPGSRK